MVSGEQVRRPQGERKGKYNGGISGGGHWGHDRKHAWEVVF